jgi:hypothetical protein
MAFNPHTINTVRETVLRFYIENKRPMPAASLADKSGFGIETIRKMAKAEVLSGIDHFRMTSSVGGKVAKRLHFEPTKPALAQLIEDYLTAGVSWRGPDYLTLSDGRVKNTQTGVVYPPPDYRNMSDFPKE